MEPTREEFISEPIAPAGSGRDTAAMSRGEPGAPDAFTWRGRSYGVRSVLNTWKQSGPEPGGEIYLRRHCFDLLMDSGERWNVYFQRQSPKSGNPKRRWFLYSITHAPEINQQVADRADRPGEA